MTAAEDSAAVRVSAKAFRRFYYRMNEADEERTLAYIAKHPEHAGDCTHQCHTCAVCFMEQMEREIAEYWAMLVEEGEEAEKPGVMTDGNTIPKTNEEWMYWQKLVSDEHDRQVAEIKQLRAAIAETDDDKTAAYGDWVREGRGFGA